MTLASTLKVTVAEQGSITFQGKCHASLSGKVVNPAIDYGMLLQELVNLLIVQHGDGVTHGAKVARTTSLQLRHSS